MATLLFAMIFKFLPDIHISWRDVWVGSFLTSLLFTLIKFLFSLYFHLSTIASLYGAAGSLVILLIWVYFSAMILFLGAEFTCVYASRRGRPVQPSSYAERIEKKSARQRQQKGHK